MSKQDKIVTTILIFWLVMIFIVVPIMDFAYDAVFYATGDIYTGKVTRKPKGFYDSGSRIYSSGRRFEVTFKDSQGKTQKEWYKYDYFANRLYSPKVGDDIDIIYNPYLSHKFKLGESDMYIYNIEPYSGFWSWLLWELPGLASPLCCLLLWFWFRPKAKPEWREIFAATPQPLNSEYTKSTVAPIIHYWKKNTVAVSGRKVWWSLGFTCSIDVDVDGKRVLSTGGKLRSRGTETAQFVVDGKMHMMKLEWKASGSSSEEHILYLNYEVFIDNISVGQSTFFISYMLHMIITGILIVGGALLWVFTSGIGPMPGRK